MRLLKITLAILVFSLATTATLIAQTATGEVTER